MAVFKELRSSRTALFMSLGGAMQLAVISTMTTWLPSFFNRVHGYSTQQSGAITGLSILAFSIGAAVWGKVIDRAGARISTRKMYVLSWLCIATTATFALAFGAIPVGKGQIAMIILGGFLMSCTLGTVLSITLDVIHPAFRATAAAFTTLVGNLGIAAGPFLLGVMSDRIGLQTALTLLPFSSLAAAYLFWLASRTYVSDTVRATEFSNTN
jgi:MFS family permease